MVKYNFKALIADKEFHENRRITYDEITQKTGISRQTLTKLATKKGHNVTVDIVEKLCRFFNCTFDAFMTMVPDSEPLPPLEDLLSLPIKEQLYRTPLKGGSSGGMRNPYTINSSVEKTKRLRKKRARAVSDGYAKT